MSLCDVTVCLSVFVCLALSHGLSFFPTVDAPLPPAHSTLPTPVRSAPCLVCVTPSFSLPSPWPSDNAGDGHRQPGEAHLGGDHGRTAVDDGNLGQPPLESGLPHKGPRPWQGEEGRRMSPKKPNFLMLSNIFSCRLGSSSSVFFCLTHDWLTVM